VFGGTSAEETRQALYVLRNTGTTVAVEEQYVSIFWMCVCRLRHPTCHAHAPYCHPWPARLYNISPHYFINGTFSKKKKLLNVRVFWFSLQIRLKHFSFEENWEKFYHTSTKVLT